LLLLHDKEARRSVLEPFAGESLAGCSGKRVTDGQRLMQATSDLFLGWAQSPEGYDFYFRQLQDRKAAANIDRMTGATLCQYAVFCCWALARGHAKGGGYAAAIAGYLGRQPVFDEAITAFAQAYADQNQRGYETVAHFKAEKLAEHAAAAVHG
jgi:hypothetical protein